MINLVCGNRHLPSYLFEQSEEVDFAGIDRGALILLEHGIQPVFSVGDFDSVSEKEKELLKSKLNIKPVKAEKDDTDLALGVEQAVQSGYKNINVFGATGGRLDHFFGAVQILLKSEYQDKNIHIKLIDQQNEISLLQVDQHVITQDKTYKYISFIPVSGEVVITLNGFKYNLEKKKLKVGSTLTISNELHQPEGFVELIEGQVLMIKSVDKQ